ncbi:MAG: thiamine-phosphate kinase [Aureliella sp.]|jgi:thiamine-monophosphate kinase
MEQSFVAWAKMRAARLSRQVKLGIGDDAAVLDASLGDFVVTTDSLLDGTHFILKDVDPRRLGRKLVNVNLSDLAAMAAEPDAVFVSLCLPDGQSDELAAELFEGICEAAERHNCAVAGGDTNCWSGPLALHLTAIGRAQPSGVWTRSGAEADDLIVVTGPLGGSLLGKHYDFEPRLAWSRAVRGQVAIHAAIDISDGLSIDLLRLATASGCGAVLDMHSVPISAAARQMAERSGREPLDHALGDGEDFELLLAVPESELAKLHELVGPEQAISVGRFTSRTGLWARRGSRIEQIPATGYVHGAHDDGHA